jgi:hypothetical protein
MRNTSRPYGPPEITEPWFALGFMAWFKTLPLANRDRIKQKARLEKMPLISVCNV